MELRPIITGEKARLHSPENDYEIKIEPIYLNGKLMMTRKNTRAIYLIYKLVVGDKVYIGQSCREPTDRWQHGKGYKHSNPFLYKAIMDIGWENVKKYVIAYAFSDNDAICKEKYFISKYDSFNPIHGYNLSAGGELGVKYTEDMRKRMSESHTGLKESENTKRKKSNKIFAIKDNELWVCDSAKLFAQINGSTKDYIKNCLRKPCSFKEYHVIYADKDKRYEIVNKIKSPREFSIEHTRLSKLLDEIFDLDMNVINDNGYDIKYLHYDDCSDKGYTIKQH